MNPVEKTVYQCPRCKKCYEFSALAEQCCKPKSCKTCGKELPEHYSHTYCNSCYRNLLAKRASTMTFSEYKAKFPDYPIVYDDDQYLYVSNKDEVNWESHVYFGAIEEDVFLDTEAAIIELEENSGCEDELFSKEAYEEYRDFVYQWNAKYGAHVYWINESIVIVPDEKEN